MPRIFAALLVALAVVGCAVNPVSKKPEVVMMSESKEQALGDEAAKRVDAEMGLVKDPALVAYVSQLGNRLAARSPRQNVPYQFGIIDQDEPNAFALPGGYVYVSRGILKISNDEDEIANAIAHEIVHVAARHHVQRSTAALGVGILSLPGVLVGSAIGGSVGSALAAPFQAAGVGVIAGYSRDQEREADRVGQQIAAQSGYDPSGLTALMRSLEYTESLREGEPRIPGFFDTHPTTPERTSQASQNAQKVAFSRERSEAQSRATYLRRIEGLLVGQNPAEGVFRGSKFLHPDLGFAMRFPEDWKTVNSRSAVGAMAPKEDGWVVLQVAGKGDDARAAGAAFLQSAQQESSISIERSGELLIGDRKAFRAFALARGRGGLVGLDVTFVPLGGLVYGILGAAPAKPEQPHYKAFHATAASFRAIRPDERTSIFEERLQVATARAGETIGQLTSRTANVWSPQETAVFNGLSTGASLSEGQLLKIAVRRKYGGGAQ